MNTATFNQSFVDKKINALQPLFDLVARVFLSTIFLLAGINKIQQYEYSAQYLASSGLPAELLPLAIVFEIVAALFIIAGFQTRLTALALAGFSLVTAFLFHNNLGDQIQFILFFKNIAMAGGFLALANSGAGKLSIDAILRKSAH